MGIAVGELAEKINEQVGINRAASRRMAKTLIEMANSLSKAAATTKRGKSVRRKSSSKGRSKHE